jgi:hypothetical protein
MSNSETTSGLSVLTILGLIFVTLKLMGYITWSWWWVTLPFWGIIAILLVIAIVALMLFGLQKLFKR